MTTRPDIVVGIGDQPSAIGATRFALEEAQARGRNVVLARAYPVTPAAPYFDPRAYDQLEVESRRVVEGVIDQVDVPAGVDVRTVLDCALPLSLLRRLAETAALVVLGQDRLPVVDRLLSGSVASPLSAKSPCPVAIVPAGYGTAATRGPTVVAVDGETPAGQALRLAFEEAESRHTDLIVLHVVPLDSLPSEQSNARVSVAEQLAGWKADHPDIAVREIVAPGEPAEVIATVSERAGLLIVGHPHERRLGGWVRSVAHAVLADSCCPLLVAPRAAKNVQGEADLPLLMAAG